MNKKVFNRKDFEHYKSQHKGYYSTNDSSYETYLDEVFKVHHYKMHDLDADFHSGHDLEQYYGQDWMAILPHVIASNQI